MGLATLCPFCQTTFRVTDDQLKLRAGLVRCGHCHQVFNGNAHLAPSQHSAAGLLPPADTPPLSNDAHTAPVLTDASIEITTEITTEIATKTAMETADDPLTLAKINAAWELPPHSSEIGDDTPDDMSDDTADHTPDEATSDALMIESYQQPYHPDLLRPSSDMPDDTAQPSLVAVNARFAAAPLDDDDDDGSGTITPTFVRTALRQQRRAGMMRLLTIIAIVLLGCSALAQSLYLWRHQIATALPLTRPLLMAACAPLGCTVGLLKQIDQLSIESNELQATVPGKATLTLSLLLRNHADVTLAWPHIELTLNDADETALVRRMFSPSEYLRTPQTTEAGIAANTEQAVAVSFTLVGVVASGYRVYLFYP